jgi:hypothetical protein
LQVEKPISGWNSSAFDFHPTLAGMLSPTLIRDQIVPVGEPGEKRLLASFWMMKPFHRKQFCSMALCACSSHVLVTGLWGAASTAYQPAFFSWNQRRTRCPLAAPAVAVTWSTQWRNRWPRANTRKPWR